jgi:BASS family bile acid:Na+ symporter
LFQQPALAIPSVVYALTMNFGAIAFLWIVRRQEARSFA